MLVSRTDWKEKYPEYVTKSGILSPKATVEVKTDVFCIRATEVHKGFYSYDNVEYVSAKVPVRIECPVHGTFFQTPDSHLSGKGCDKCGQVRSNNSKLLNTSSFITSARLVHGNTYDYSKTVYVKNTEKVIITCRVHGDFEQLPANHKKGHGCPKCGSTAAGNTKAKHLEDFILQATLMHGDKYIYSGNYVNAHTKISIDCKIHGVFEQTPNSHLRGQGCPICANKNYSIIYLVEYSGLGIKVGVTSNKSRRLRELVSSSPVPIIPLNYWQVDSALDLEQLVLRSFTKAKVPYKFDGCTEILAASKNELEEFINARI